MQKIFIAGRVGRVEEVRKVGDSTVLNFSVAVRVYRGKDKEEGTNWYSISLWNSVGLYPYITVGMPIAVEGEPGVNAYLSKDGEAKASMTIRAGSVTLLGSKGDAEQQANVKHTHAETPVVEPEDDDIPF